MGKKQDDAAETVHSDVDAPTNQPFVMPEISLDDLGKSIDAVVTWVDGADPNHADKRARYLDKKVSGHAKSQVRFRDTDEIRYCLRSIRNHASWIRNIWLVTDNQFPASIDRDLAASENVHAVDHRAIFAGYEDCLPTFNSLSIETLMWRIPGLSDRFLYFNDDMLLTAPVEPEDFFANGKVVLRGKWKNAEKMETIGWNIHNQIASAKVTGFDPTHFWSPAHVAHPMVRSVVEAMYRSNQQRFEENARPRFRKKSQWWLVSIHDNCLIGMDRAKTIKPSDVIHFPLGFCKTAEPARIRTRLEQAAHHDYKLACVNDVATMLEKVPETLDFIAEATGPVRAFERPKNSAQG